MSTVPGRSYITVVAEPAAEAIVSAARRGIHDVHLNTCLDPAVLRPRGRIAGLMIDIAAVRSHSCSEIVAVVRAAGIGVPVLLLATVGQRDCQLLVELAQHGVDMEVVLPQFEKADTAVERWVRSFRNATLPTTTLLYSFATRRHPLPRPTLVAALVAGRRRLRVLSFARCCGVPERTVRQHLYASGLPGPHRFLGWTLALYTAWRLERLGMSHRAVADEAGFNDVRSLSAFLRANVLRSIRSIETSGFDRLLAWCLEQRTTIAPRSA